MLNGTRPNASSDGGYTIPPPRLINNLMSVKIAEGGRDDYEVREDHKPMGMSFVVLMLHVATMVPALKKMRATISD